jgi:hypothetical protein
LGRVVAFFRGLSESTSLSDSAARIKAGIRGLTESVSISDILIRITPTVNRYIYDLGAVFDIFYFDPNIFDTNVKAYAITDSVARSDRHKHTITEPTISISDSLARIKSGIRAISDSVSISDSLARVKGGIRTISDSISISDSVGIVQSIFRTITDSVSISDSVSRTIVRYITLPESVSISDSLSILSGRAREAIAHLLSRTNTARTTKRTDSSEITKRSTSIRTDELRF